MAEDQYAGITTVSAEPPPETPPAEAPPETPPPAPWEAKLVQLERLTQQLQMDNARQQATIETMQRLQPPSPPAEPPAPPGPPQRPRTEDFGTDQAAYDRAMETWIDARSAYQADQRLAAQEQQRQRQAQEQELTRTQAELDGQLHAREATLRQTVPDYDSQAQQVARQMSQATYWAVRMTGERCPDLVVHLAQHPEEVQRLNAVPPHLLGLEVGRLMQQVAPPAPPETPAGETPPPPPTPAPPAQVATRPPPAAPPTMVPMGSVVPPTGFFEGMDQRSYEAERRRQNPRLFRR